MTTSRLPSELRTLLNKENSNYTRSRKRLASEQATVIQQMRERGENSQRVQNMAESYADDAQELADQHYERVRSLYEQYGYRFDEYDHSLMVDTSSISQSMVDSGKYDLTDSQSAVSFSQDLMNTVSRHRMSRNISRDPSHPQWARVPTGLHTCAFCAMLASRGFTYTSQEAAGGKGNQYHAHCSCRQEPSWGATSLEGYHPEVYQDLYDTARAGLGDNPSTSEILSAMRSAGKTVLTDAQPSEPAFSMDWATSKKLLSMKGESKGTVASWIARQEAVGVPQSVERLERHEIVFCEKFKHDGHDFQWIPKSDQSKHNSTNDFIWVDHGNTPTELKSLQTTKYHAAASRISDAVNKAKNNGVVKDTFILDYGNSSLPEKLYRQLSRYNIVHDASRQIKELWVYDSLGLHQINLK